MQNTARIGSLHSAGRATLPGMSTTAVPVRPTTATQWQADYARVADAIAWLDANAVKQPRLGDVAAALHLSPGHLQRVFTRFAGTSPSRFLRWLTADAARQLLRERATVLDATAEVGLSSPGRLHDLLVTVDGVTPGEVGRRGDGLDIKVGVHPTPLGAVLLGVTPRGVCTLQFVADGEVADETTAERVVSEWPAAAVVRDDDATRATASRVVAAIEGAADGQPLPVLLAGTNLQLKVWEALLRIPDDRVVTYREVARAAGHPTAVRAVASAVGRNPVAWLVPCHRVLRATGGLGGYRWGETRKRVLLAREAARAEDEPDRRRSAPRRPRR